ncbi:unnamed protein product [Medioppia subpectinata]|uniref:Uncharacterized protein n=1 Tax=Medioppia subpectinata TaxID=1979941 RepID=A0A7R9KWE9_9ACAR|nr:unnamed protein product [Medioppia subpectinata]CAG2110995.1 unnamed protein product [Medioppia subpectinata]
MSYTLNNNIVVFIGAAVFEHILQGNGSTDEPSIIIQKNLNVIKQAAIKASENGANILVFPEYCLIDPMTSRKTVAAYTETIPDPRHGSHNPCAKPLEYKSSPATLALSCLAKETHMYIVADYGDRYQCNVTSDPKCPKDGHYMHDTAVAFDPNGAIVAKYHKSHTWFEFEYDTPPPQEFVYFDTPFGRMGLQICFDIWFKNPGIKNVAKYGVQTMLFPTDWFDELPLQSAKQVQESWAVANRVNLLAANQLDPQMGTLGSGIYAGQNGAIVYTNITTKTSKLLIADIPVDSRNPSASCLKPDHRFNKTISFETLKTDGKYQMIDKMYTKGHMFNKLTASESSSVVCDSGFCCHLNYSLKSVDDLKGQSFWWFVGNTTIGRPIVLVYPVCTEICGVFRCVDDRCESFPTHTSDQTVFKWLRLSATFNTNTTYPSLTTNDLALVPKQYWVYENRQQINGSEVSLDLNNYDKPLLAMGLYGRCFNRDLPLELWIYPLFIKGMRKNRVDIEDMSRCSRYDASKLLVENLERSVWFVWDNQYYWAQLTDNRLRHMVEIISGMRVIKMYSWEQSFADLVAEARNFITLVLTGEVLTAKAVFVSMMLFNYVRVNMTWYFPQSIAMGAELLVSCNRIQESPFPTLQNISAHLRAGDLLAVIGPVGAGKSSLLMTVLNELPVLSGSIKTVGSISYASQEPWNFNNSVQNNILFGAEYNESRYKRVVEVCALERDFEIFPFGDKTLVGERGVSLSGGQKARITLARALYRNSDIVLMDDPLSAVDTSVAEHIFDK